MKKNKNLPHSVIKKFNNALNLQNNNFFIDAITIYQELVSKYPGKFEFELNLATSLYGNGNLKEATEKFHKLHEIYPVNTIILASCSACYLDLGYYELALDFLKLLIKVDESNVTAWLNMTYICNILKKK